MKVYGLKNCDTCRAALRAMPGAELVDLREAPLPDRLLDRGLELFGTSLVNRRSATWRGLDEAARQAAPRALLRAHPPLMKRPLIETDDGTLYLGWSSDVRRSLGVA